jgi:hypothetical protein
MSLYPKISGQVTLCIEERRGKRKHSQSKKRKETVRQEGDRGGRRSRKKS